MTDPERCVYCAADGLGRCVSCQSQVCNRHLVLSVQVVDFLGPSRLAKPLAGFGGVRLIHPLDSSIESISSDGAYLAAFILGDPRCLACRDHDGREAVRTANDVRQRKPLAAS
jgi:hypothetical protein